MLKNRLIAAIIVKNGHAVQSVGFQKFLPIGDPVIAAEYFNRWGADEILLVDISARHTGGGPDFELIRKVSRSLFVPLTYAGGVRSPQDAVKAVHEGADKIAINSAALDRPDIISETAEILGNQAVIAAADVIRRENGKLTIRAKDGSSFQLSPGAWVSKMLDRGAGEILINSADKDGTKLGYDTDALSQLSENCSVPVIAMGGAGNPDHIASALKIAGVGAAVIGNALHYSEHSLFTFRAALAHEQNQLRQDLHVSYPGCPIMKNGRLGKYSESQLAESSFVYPQEEKL